MYPIDPNDKRDPSQRAYDYLMGGASYRNPYLNYADTAGATPAMPSTKDIGDNHWEYDPLTKAWRMVAGKSADAAEAPKTVADVSEQYQKASGSSAPFGYDAQGNARTSPQTNLTDSEWSAVKQMRDEQGFFNPYETANLKAFGSAALGMLGGPAGFASGAYRAKGFGDEARGILQNYMQHSSSGLYQPSAEPAGMSSALGTPEWTAAVNQTANARLLRQGATGTEDPSGAGLASALQEIRDRAAQDSGGAEPNITGGTYISGNYTPPAESRPVTTYYESDGTSSTDGASGGYLQGGQYQRPTQHYAAGGLGSLGSYSDGGRLLRGPGDGVSDGIPAVIGKDQPAKLADGEFVLPARVVSELGNGSTEAGAKKLYAMMDRIEKAQRNAKRGKDSKADKYLPA